MEVQDGGRGEEMLSSLITSTFQSSLCGSELHCCSAPARSFWPLLMSQLCKVAPWDLAFGAIIYFCSSYATCSFPLWLSFVQKFVILCQLLVCAQCSFGNMNMEIVAYTPNTFSSFVHRIKDVWQTWIISRM